MKKIGSDDYGDKYVRIRINLDDYLPREKIFVMCNVVILIGSVFDDENKFHPIYKLAKNVYLNIDFSFSF